MESTDMEASPPPVPMRSPLREAAGMDISAIFHNPDDDDDAGTQSHYSALSRRIDSFIERLRADTSSSSLAPTERSSKIQPKPHREFSSGVVSVSSVYSQDLDTFPPDASSAPTSSRPSYSSSRPMSTASTHTVYSTTSPSPSTKVATQPKPLPARDPPSAPTTDKLFAMIDQLPPIIYRHGTKPPPPATKEFDEIIDSVALFPPHPGVRPPPPTTRPPQRSMRLSLRRPETRSTYPAAQMTSAPSSPHKRVPSLHFSLRMRQGSC